jgi:hypothetical protein
MVEVFMAKREPRKSAHIAAAMVDSIRVDPRRCGLTWESIF